MSNQQFIEEYTQSTSPHPFIPKTRVYVVDPESPEPSYVTFEVSLRDEQIALDFIGSMVGSKRKGIASKGLKWFVSLADKHQISLELTIRKVGFDPDNLSALELRRWYKRHGFVFDRKGNGHREPASGILEYVQA